jgi:hypothetical protein
VARDLNDLRNGCTCWQQLPERRRHLALQAEPNAADWPPQGVTEVGGVSVAWEVALPVEGFRGRGVELMERLEERGLARLVPADQGGDAVQFDPAAILDVPVVLDPERCQPHRVPPCPGHDSQRNLREEGTVASSLRGWEALTRGAR